MAAQSLQSNPVDTYTALAWRIHGAIQNPRAQIAHQVTIAQEPHESDHDWECLLEELRSSEGVTLTRLANGNVHLTWFVQIEP